MPAPTLPLDSRRLVEAIDGRLADLSEV